MSYLGPEVQGTTQQRLSQGWQSVLDLVFPRSCRGCELPLNENAPREGLGGWLCQACIDNLDRIQEPYCDRCGEPFAGPMTRAFLCSNCDGRRLAFDFAVSGFKAHGPMRELIHQFKYGKDISLRAVLGSALQMSLQDPRLAESDLSQWLLVPVPLHYFRQVKRGFNQSWELCRMLQKTTGIPAASILRRTRQTSTQARLHRQQRLENLRGVFALKRSLPWSTPADLKGKKILLVDDVLTTGATAHECAKVLKREAGAEKVVVITAARG
jgi:competence protein ComFC